MLVFRLSLWMVLCRAPVHNTSKFPDGDLPLWRLALLLSDVGDGSGE
jgi:hypothetical protein